MDMTEDQNNDLTREEQEAFRSLAETRLHSISDEERIVRALQKRGLIKPSQSSRTWRWVVQATAAAAVLAGTFFVGVQYGSRSSTEVPPVVKPIREERSTTSDFAVTRVLVEDPSVLEDYRDEPDRPGDGGTLLAKTIDQ
jgi:anti-sigma-K factor RskA